MFHINCYTINMQTLLDNGILPILPDIMNTAEYKTRKEAVWAVCNDISGDTPEQIRLVSLLPCVKFGIISSSRSPGKYLHYTVDQNNIE